MPQYPGVWEVRLFYTVTPAGQTPIEHRHTFDVKIEPDYPPGTDMSDMDITKRNGTNMTLAAYVTEYMAVIEPLYHASTDFNRWEVWKYPPDGYDATFISAMTTGGIAASAVAPISQHNSILTFRTAGGSVLRLQFMEDSIAGDNQLSYPTGITAYDDVFAFAMALDSGIVAQDNTFPIASMKLSRGINNALKKRRTRPA